MLVSRILSAAVAPIPGLLARTLPAADTIAAAFVPFIQSSTHVIGDFIARCPTHDLPYLVIAGWAVVEVIRGLGQKNAMTILGGLVKAIGYGLMIFLP
jgi:hypothetical protein